MEFLEQELNTTSLDAPIEERKIVRKDYQTLENLSLCDLYLGRDISSELLQKVPLPIMMRNLPDLQEISNRHPIVKSTLIRYTQRLRELSEKDSRISEVYKAYEKVFGGKAE